MLAQWAFSVRYEKIHYKWRLYNSRSPCSFIHVDCCSSDPVRRKEKAEGRKSPGRRLGPLGNFDYIPASAPGHMVKNSVLLCKYLISCIINCSWCTYWATEKVFYPKLDHFIDWSNLLKRSRLHVLYITAAMIAPNYSAADCKLDILLGRPALTYISQCGPGSRDNRNYTSLSSCVCVCPRISSFEIDPLLKIPTGLA